MPAPLASVVITMGRARLWQASIRASPRKPVVALGHDGVPTSRMEFLVAMPISMIMPIIDGMDKGRV